MPLRRRSSIAACAASESIPASDHGSAHDGAPVHVFGLSHGIAYVELLTGLERLPVRGARFLFLPIKVKGSSGGPAAQSPCSTNPAAAVKMHTT
ncbi:hypothetical protein AiwAL_12400 [Acidiphilium sp. AL]|uniref:Uncharacterized protein n=1 Tax=Acidiphilium iwatense TaxID=768198 RepID=A0ABS9E148_9PROT|nr:hypothetical protein [Acidiphilium iwatense]MCF3947651.1 hypothetical protein [Acidiphilium iwatense]MCU4160902.1 hypothetical protein [Acidiphilium sp. AL]